MNHQTVARIRALDLFAGTGWGVACQRLGIKEQGVEIMEEAVQTRTANGMETIYRDVWDGLDMTHEEHVHKYGRYGLLIASPPCQTFSMAGNGAGRRALDEVVEAIQLHAYKDAKALREFGERHDMRTALVLTPLAHVWRDMPRLVAMEQVPTVLPVWEACADVMREWGYEVQVEVLNAEQYGVPQTRKRAILVARRGGPVQLPVPTHSRYYPRTPGKLDPGVLPWVSMAEALGWGMTDRPMTTITGGAKGQTDRWASGGNSIRKAIDARVGGSEWVTPSPGLLSGRPAGPLMVHDVRLDVDDVSLLQSYPPYGQGWGHTDRPSPTITGGGGAHGASGIELWDSRSRAAALDKIPAGTFVPNGRTVNPNTKLDPLRMSPEEAAILQSYPPYPADTVAFTQNNKLTRQAVRSMDQPAPTITAGHDSGNRGFLDADGNLTVATPEQVSALQSYPSGRGLTDRPSPTITGGGTETGGAEPIAKYHERYTSAPGWAGPTDRLSTDEAGALQSYPTDPPFIWCGTKSKKFLQIGNAVPPVLAEAILAALVGLTPGR